MDDWIDIYVVVNFLSQVIVIFYFCFNLAYITIPKTKEKQKLPKINYNIYLHYV